jgi:MYXO-CTERM domain-containing protein
MGTRDRKSHPPAALVKSAIPVLGLTPAAPPAKDGGADGGKEGDEKGKKGGCGCETPARQSGSSGGLALIGGLLGVVLLRRRRSR